MDTKLARAFLNDLQQRMRASAESFSGIGNRADDSLTLNNIHASYSFIADCLHNITASTDEDLVPAIRSHTTAIRDSAAGYWSHMVSHSQSIHFHLAAYVALQSALTMLQSLLDALTSN